MEFLQNLLLGVHGVLQLDHILHVGLIPLVKHLHGILNQPVDHIQHFAQLLLRLLAEGDA